MTRLGRRKGLVCGAAALVALGLTFGASSAAALTIGQIAPDTPTDCDPALDLLQPTVSAGDSYVVPSTGGVTAWTLTSWRSKSADPGKTLTMKIFRNVGEPNRYQVVGHEGPHVLVVGVNTFPANLKVSSGDVLGLHSASDLGPCAFEVPGEPILFRASNLADGESADFNTDVGYRANISAEITPTSDFTLGKVKAKPNGTATLQASLPNPGNLTVSGKGVKGSASAVSAKRVNAGKVKVVIRAKGRNRRKLAENGKVTVKPRITFTPTGGTAHTEKKKVKLRRK